MRAAALLLTALCAGTCAATVPSSISESHVTWTDADFKGELGNLPLGNGDVAANVWIDSDSGDLLVYIAKSDAFDQNAQPIKVGRLRYSFDPPLWQKPTAAETGAYARAGAGAYTEQDSAIVCQDAVYCPVRCLSFLFPLFRCISFRSFCLCSARSLLSCFSVCAFFCPSPIFSV